MHAKAHHAPVDRIIIMLVAGFWLLFAYTRMRARGVLS